MATLKDVKRIVIKVGTSTPTPIAPEVTSG